MLIENVLFRKAQWECYPNEMNCLKNKKSLPEKSNLIGLQPFLDEFGVLRARGRLELARCLPSAQRFPIILPPYHHITKLIIRDVHERYLHQGDNTVIGVIQQKFYIDRVRIVLKTIKIHCRQCIERRLKPNPPLMAALPDVRVQPYIYPFVNSWVDYFGPFNVCRGRSTEKKWGVIFTCLSTRASHIEMADKLDTDSFLICLRNFQNRRGKVNRLYSDNGTNFVGANNEMKDLIDQINEKMGRGVAASMKIQWYFNPPLASHFGGVWERLIRCVRNSLAVLLKSFGYTTPRLETLRAALIQAEFFLNSRPLTHVPISHYEAEVPTPFHALIHWAGEYAPPLSLDEPKDNNKQWKKIQYAGKMFWDRWKAEYIPTLARRNKWTKRVEPIKVDDIVIATENSLAPGHWTRGRVIEAIAAPDGHVRTVTVKTSEGKVFKRSVHKLAVLNLDSDESD